MDETRDIVVLQEEDAARPAPASPDAEVVELQEEADGKLPPRAEPQPDGSVILPLDHPVTLAFRRAGSPDVREERFERLHLRRLTGADMRAIAAAGENAGVVAIARSARIDQQKFNALFDRMDGADAHAASRVVEHFLGNGRKTGR